MNILPRIEARQYTTGAEIIAEAMRRKARLAAAQKLKTSAISEPPKRAHMAKQCPLWEFEAVNFDQHIVDYRRHLWLEVERQGSPTRAYVRSRCDELSVSYAAIMGRTRVRKVSDLRQLLMWEVHSKFGLSYPAIGRLFGGRDHTTALYSVSKIEAERNADAAKAQEFVAKKILMREKANHYRALAKAMEAHV